MMKTPEIGLFKCDFLNQIKGQINYLGSIFTNQMKVQIEYRGSSLVFYQIKSYIKYLGSNLNQIKVQVKYHASHLDQGPAIDAFSD